MVAKMRVPEVSDAIFRVPSNLIEDLHAIDAADRGRDLQTVFKSLTWLPARERDRVGLLPPVGSRNYSR
jgi:hypothetical protein